MVAMRGSALWGAGGVPICHQGAQWYAENTLLIQGVRYYKTDPRVAGLKEDAKMGYHIPIVMEIEEPCNS